MKCIVHGCENEKWQGAFVGEICASCHGMLVTGVVGKGGTFIHKLFTRAAVTAAVEGVLQAAEISPLGDGPVPVVVHDKSVNCAYQSILRRLKSLVED